MSPQTSPAKSRWLAGDAGCRRQAPLMGAILAMVVLLGLAGVSRASDSLREHALALERACRTVEAVKIYRRAARDGDGKSAKRLSEIYDQGIDGVPRDYAESLKWKVEALRLGEQAPAPRPHNAGPPPACKPQARSQSRSAPAIFEFRMAYMPGAGSDEVELRHDGLVFESRRIGRPAESATLKPSAERWQAFRESLDRLNVWQWRPEYHRPIPDGTGWSLRIQYADRQLTAEGHNNHPENFGAFLEAVNTLLGGRKFR